MGNSNIGLGLYAQLDQQAREQLFHWRDRVFPEEGKAFKWAESTRHIVALDGGNAVGHLGFGIFTVEDVERKMMHQVVGVGGVVVRPEYQGQNIPQKMFNFLHQLEELSKEIFTLFCPERLIRYYEKHAYSAYLGELTVLQEDKFLTIAPMRFMYRGQVQFSDRLRVHSNPW